MGMTLAWVGLGLAIVALVIASVIGLMSLADGVGTGQDFPSTSD